jgi:hypothetical protein
VGAWWGLEQTTEGKTFALLYIYADGRVSVFVDGQTYPLNTHLEEGKVFWTYVSRSGTTTLYEGNGTRVLAVIHTTFTTLRDPDGRAVRVMTPWH